MSVLRANQMDNESRIRLLLENIMEHSRYRRAAEAAGFKFHSLSVRYDYLMDAVHAILSFECVCGKKEALSHYFQTHVLDSKFVDKYLDLCAILHHSGSFSYKHLIDDGYSHEQALEIARKYQEAL